MSLSFKYLILNLLSKFLIGLTGVFIARFYGPSDFGIFSSSYAMVMFLVAFINFGMIENLITNFFKLSNKNLIQNTIKNILLLFILLISFVYLVTNPFFLYMFIWGAFFRIGTQLNIAILQVSQHIVLTSIIQFLNGIIYFLNIYLAYSLNLSLFEFIVMNMFSFVIFFLIVFMYSKNIIKFNLDMTFPDNIVQNSYRYGISAILAYVYMSSDIVMIKYLSEDYYAGIYAAASTIVIFLYFIPDIFYRFYLTLFDKFKKNNQPIIKKIEDFYNLNIIILGSATLFILFFSKEIIQIIYTDAYMDTASYLYLYAFILFIHSFCFIPGLLLTVNGRQKEKNFIQLQVAILNITLNFIFIKYYGAIGAIYATILTEIYLLINYMRLSKVDLNDINIINFQKSIKILVIIISSFLFIKNINLNYIFTIVFSLLAVLIIFYFNKKNFRSYLRE